jgi:hypothetical protein
MTETVDIRNKTRRVKDHILNRFLALADRVDQNEILRGSEKDLYEELMFTFAKNVVPRSHELGGDPDNTTPIPILMNTSVPTHNGDQENKPASSENPGSTRRDIS